MIVVLVPPDRRPNSARLPDDNATKRKSKRPVDRQKADDSIRLPPAGRWSEIEGEVLEENGANDESCSRRLP